MKKIKILVGIIILIVVAFGAYFVFFKKEKPEYSVAKVTRGNIIQSVSETGTVKKGETINLSFKSSGKIERIYVEVGNKIVTGQNLARLDTNQLSLQLVEDQAVLELAKAKMADAQISLENTERDLNNIKEKAEEDLNNAYEDALTVLDDAYLKIYNTYNTVHNIQKTYFSTPNEDGLKVIEEKVRIENALKKVESLLSSVKSDSEHDNIDSVLPQTKEMLEKVGNAIKGIRDITDNAIYRDLVSSTDKASLDTHKLNINTVLTNLINSQQNISTIKITNQTNIDSAEAKVSTLKAQLQPDGLYQAQINQAQAQIPLLQKQIQESTLQSPTDGQVIDVKKRDGETVQPSETVIALLPASPFQIEVDIYEEDIVKVKIGDPVDIKLTAFPEKIFKGKVILIDPAEKIIEGVVYYKVTIDFDASTGSASTLSGVERVEEPPEDLKPGMTVDIEIKTASKENVLVIPAEAVEKDNGKSIVQVIKGKNLEQREIETGLKGSDNMIEVVSGLKEGETIAIK